MMARHKCYRQELKAPPPTPPELDPQCREPADETIIELPEHPKLHRALMMLCQVHLGVPSQPVAAEPTWPTLPIQVRRSILRFLFGLPFPEACAVQLTSRGMTSGDKRRGRQGWAFVQQPYLPIPELPWEAALGRMVQGSHVQWTLPWEEELEPWPDTDDGF